MGSNASNGKIYFQKSREDIEDIVSVRHRRKGKAVNVKYLMCSKKCIIHSVIGKY